MCIFRRKTENVFLFLGYHCFSVCNNSSVCVVFRKMFVAMEIEGAFSPGCWDSAEQRETLGLEEQHQCLPWIWDLCWSEPGRAQPWLCVSTEEPSVLPEPPFPVQLELGDSRDSSCSPRQPSRSSGFVPCGENSAREGRQQGCANSGMGWSCCLRGNCRSQVGATAWPSGSVGSAGGQGLR